MTKRDAAEDESASLASDATLHSPVPRGAEPGQLPPLDEARYRLDPGVDAMLGKGGQGVVWRGRDEVLRREVALKQLRRELAGDDATLAAFLREARLTAMLEHPGIVPLHDLGLSADGFPTLVLRRIEGQSLAETLAQTPSLDARLSLVPALLRACQAVAYAHQRHVVHRDLKPQNIMLGPLGETYVLDWGLALVGAAADAPEITAPREGSGVVGTPAYMSPEQALGLPADERSDVWGLGACLYQLLTGHPPIGGGSVQSAMGHAAGAQISPVRAMEPGVPDDLAAICEKALSSERSARYPSAVALAGDLERWLAGRTVSAREYSRFELLKRAVQANRAAFVVGLVALLALGAALGFDELRVRRERNEAREFARTLLHDSLKAAQTHQADLTLVALLSERTREWLGRRDLSDDEQADLCTMLIALANFNHDAAAWDAGLDFDRQAVAIAESGMQRRPDDPRFFSCASHARVDQLLVELSRGDGEAGGEAFPALERDFAAWRGPVTPQVRLAHVNLLHEWGLWAWERDPAVGAAKFVEAATLATALLREDAVSAESALPYGANGALALWSLGRRAAALELTRVFAEAARPQCARSDASGERLCLSVRTSYFQLLSWSDPVAAQALLDDVVSREARLLARSDDSSTVLHDAIWATFERGDFEGCRRLAKRSQTQETITFLAAAMVGDFTPLTESPPEVADPPVLLAQAIAAVAQGRPHDAAHALRDLEPDRLWVQLSWPAQPRPSVVLPPAARPAFERFLADFTRAYGDADQQALAASVEAWAAALDAL